MLAETGMLAALQRSVAVAVAVAATTPHKTVAIVVSASGYCLKIGAMGRLEASEEEAASEV